ASSPTYFIVTCPTPSSTLFPYTTLFRSRHTLAHAIQQGFQAFVGVELRVGNQPGRVVENGVEHGLLFAPARPWDVGTKHHVRLRSEEHTSELQSRVDLVCRLLLEKKKQP